MTRSGSKTPSQPPSPSEIGPGAPPPGATAAAGTTSRFAWRPEYSVGIDEIDAQHQELFRRAGLFIESLQRQSRQEVGILLSFLRLYAVTHFGAEEAWMREASYPGTLEHEKQHDRFIKDILALSDQHEKPRGPGIEPDRVAGWLEKWLKNHVTEVDADLARHLRASGVPAPKPAEPQD
ncbi:MAG: hemerythrin family protein [Anaeromyxobacter sp.]|nr:hemerythrin family protein [Anaeromyxobacter sp.]MBL0274512.1 hemerythrin family protein [Anaeromyxobacter sp.]